VTDTAIEAKAETGLSLPVRLLLTAALLAVFVLGYFVPIPGLATDLPPLVIDFQGALSVVALGINPLLIGFALVEIFSLATSAGRRVRARGDVGRATLNQAALATSLIVSALRGLQIARALSGITMSNGMPMVPDPGPSFQVLAFLTLTAATAGIYLLGSLITALGIGNGFGLLMSVQILWWSRGFWVYLRSQNLDIAFELPGFLLIAALIGLLIWWFRRADDAWTVAFPQGIVPVLWTSFALQYGAGWFLPHSQDRRWIGESVVVLILVAVFSWLMYLLFSSRSRLAASLTESEEVVNELAADLRARMLVATAFLALGAAALWAWDGYRPTPVTGFFNLLTLAVLVAVALDLRSQIRFLARNPQTALLARLDDVHFADRLALHLEEAGIDATVRGYRLRSLYFFFGALFKMDVLVPAGDLEPARRVLFELQGARELEAF
jgi:ABC-type multidrug transport system fused ATPase/permease subunit